MAYSFLNKLQILLRSVLLAIVAHEFYLAFFVAHNVEVGWHVVLLVGDAVGVEAFHDVIDVLRYLHSLLRCHFVVVNLDERCGGGNERYLVYLLWLEVLVGNLDDALGAVFLAFEVGAEIYRFV